MAGGGKKSKQSDKPIYVIVGKDKFLVNQQCQELLDELLTEQERAMALLAADADKIAAVEVFDELRTLPFLAKKRVVLLKDAEDFISKNRPSLERYFDNPGKCGVLVLTVKSWPKSTKLAKKLAKVGRLITVAELKPWQLPQYAMDYAAGRHGKTMHKSAAQLLVELVGDGPGNVIAEIDKLAVYAGAAKTIRPADIEALIGHNRLFNAFAVIDAMTAGTAAKGIERLRKMFAADKNAPFTVVGACAFHFRKMFNAKALLEKGDSPDRVASKLRIWGDRQGFFRQLNRITLAQIGSAIQQLARIDYAVKTGQTRPQVAIEQLVLRLTTR